MNLSLGSSNVRAITFCEGRHSIASVSDNGKIAISRIEYIKKADLGKTKYSGCRPLQEINLENDHAMCLKHFENDNESLLVFPTSKGKIIALDLRSMKVAWKFQSQSNFGEISAMMLEPKRSWVMTGTHRGVLSLWDIRFNLNLVLNILIYL